MINHQMHVYHYFKQEQVIWCSKTTYFSHHLLNFIYILVVIYTLVIHIIIKRKRVIK